MAEIQSGYSSLLGGGSTSSVSSALSYAGPIMAVVGALQSGIGAYYSSSAAKSSLAYQQNMYAINEKISAINARMAENTAQSIILAGQKEQGRVSLRAGKVRGAQRASQGARGIQAGVGNAAEEIATTNLMKEIDMLTINANTVRAAWDARMSGVNARTASINAANASLMASASAASISPFMATGTSLLNSGATVASSWYQSYRQSKIDSLLFRGVN